MCDHPTARGWARPRWRTLYAIIGVAAVATAITRTALPASLLRSATLLAIPVVAALAMALWVATNRVALDLTGWCECAARTVRVRVVAASAPPPPRVTADSAEPVERTTLRG